MADYSDFRDKNTKFTGTTGERISTGTTLERVDETGRLRFNTTNNLMEYYDGTTWKAIDSPPVLSSISPSTFASDGATLYDIDVTGSGFSTTVTALWIGEDGTEYTPSVVTRNSATSVTVRTVATMDVANEPYDIKITNSSGLAATLADALDAGATPAFSAAAGSLGTLSAGARAASNLTSQTFGPDQDDDSQTITYTVTSGSLPAGLSLGTGGNNGTIQGTADSVGTNTTSSFTITASDGVNTNSRSYSITVNAPQIQTFTSSGTFSVPAGVTGVDVLVVAGGGGGGGDRGSGGGAGGLIFRPGFSVTPGGSVSVTVGDGGGGGPSNNRGNPGSNSVFGSLTSIGGGTGNNAGSGGGFSPVMNGGSGGGSVCQGTAGSGNQPSQPGDSGTFGFGNRGGNTNVGVNSSTAGGGGAGAVGGDCAPGTGTPQGSGGIGRQYDISGSATYYAGGGGGGKSHPGETNKAAGSGGLGGGAPGGVNPGQVGGTATANTGGGGGGGAQSPIASGGPGGKGIVIVSY